MPHDLPPLALSVRQPWAWAILNGKDVENRSWRKPNPGLNFRGRVALHASGGMTRDEYEDASDTIIGILGHCPPAHELQRGGIVGSVEIVDCVRVWSSPWFFGPVGLVLRDPRPCGFIVATGALGFFKWTPGDPAKALTPARWMLPAGTLVKPAAAPADLFGGEK